MNLSTTILNAIKKYSDNQIDDMIERYELQAVNQDLSPRDVESRLQVISELKKERDKRQSVKG